MTNEPSGFDPETDIRELAGRKIKKSSRKEHLAPDVAAALSGLHHWAKVWPKQNWEEQSKALAHWAVTAERITEIITELVELEYAPKPYDIASYAQERMWHLPEQDQLRVLRQVSTCDCHSGMREINKGGLMFMDWCHCPLGVARALAARKERS